jgi:hypothetical protein
MGKRAVMVVANDCCTIVVTLAREKRVLKIEGKSYNVAGKSGVRKSKEAKKQGSEVAKKQSWELEWPSERRA